MTSRPGDPGGGPHPWARPLGDTASVTSLRAAAAAVDDQHRAGMATLREELGEVQFGETGRALAAGRRRFLKQAGLAGAMVSFGSVVLPASRLLPAAWGQSPESGEELDDLTVSIFAEQVELAVVAAYQAAEATGLLDPAAVEVATLFTTHHADHGAAFASFAGDQATGVANEAVLAEFSPLIAAAPDQASLLRIAFDLEQGATATYHFALGVLGAEAAAAVSTILPIEAQHAVVLGQFLGLPMEEWMPPFETSDGAIDPSTYPLTEA